MSEEVAIPAEDKSLRRKEIVNIVANFLSSNRNAELLDEWSMTEEAAARLAKLLAINGY